MDVPTALLRIKRQFGDEYDVIINNDDIYGWIYEAELDIIRNTGSHDFSQTVSSTLFPSAVPDSVTISVVSINGKALTFTSKSEIILAYSNLDAIGEPGFWYLEDKKIYLYPFDPTVSQNVDMTYSKIPVLMAGLPASNTFVIPENYRTDLVNFCIAKAHNKNRNYQAERTFMDLYDRSLGLRRDEEQSQDGPIYKSGDPMDYVDYNDWYY